MGTNHESVHDLGWEMNEFEKCAREYCAAKTKWLEIRKQMRALPCEWEDPGLPCWMDDRNGDPIPVEDRCDSCQKTYELKLKRWEIGSFLPGLAKAMYRAFREGWEK